MQRSGDGFIRCSDGRPRWGIYGAAGALFVHRSSGTVMLQQRSAWSHEGGTWSVPGGALDWGETALEGALREASEEVGAPDNHEVVGEYVFAPADDWSYTTVIIAVDEPFGDALNFETDGVDWVPFADVESRPLHDGFAAAWPDLRRLVEEPA